MESTGKNQAFPANTENCLIMIRCSVNRCDSFKNIRRKMINQLGFPLPRSLQGLFRPFGIGPLFSQSLTELAPMSIQPIILNVCLWIYCPLVGDRIQEGWKLLVKEHRQRFSLSISPKLSLTFSPVFFPTFSPAFSPPFSPNCPPLISLLICLSLFSCTLLPI